MKDLLLGVAPLSEPMRERLAARFPDAVWVILGDEAQADYDVLPTHIAPALALSRWDRVVVLQDYPKVRAFALGLRSRQTFVFQSGALEPLSVASESRRAARRSILRRRRASRRGFGNDYGHLLPVAPADLDVFPRCTVIVPVYNRRGMLRLTLEALARVDYPPDRLDVIVADDGSSDEPETVLNDLPSSLSVEVVAQEDRGYRLAAVRNLALRKARGEIIVMLDCDMIPDSALLRAYARWFVLGEQSLLILGSRTFVDAAGLSPAMIRSEPGAVAELSRVWGPIGARGTRPGEDWREELFRDEHGLRRHPAPFTFAAGGNVAFRRADALAIGGYDESFVHWGGEDFDFAFRLMRRGAYIVPEMGARGFHQDHPESAPREQDRKITLAQLGGRVPWYRDKCVAAPLRPELSVYVPSYNNGTYLRQAVESALAQDFHDLEVCVVDDASSDGSWAELEGLAARDSRVRIRRNDERLGAGETSRRALDLCRGEFVLQLDSDDLLLPGAAWELLRVLREDREASLVYGGFERVDTEGKLLRETKGEGFSWERALVGCITTHPRMFRARDYYRTRGFDPALRSSIDFDIYLRLARVGRVHHVGKILYRHRWHGDNMSVLMRGEQQKNHRAIAERFLREADLPWRLDASDPEDLSRYRLVHAQTGKPISPSLLRRALLRFQRWGVGA